ncbi:unnamed protein product [Moneuplotes crassus]|uniref:Uncharacterized protein n=1 Tax=Euplotes crassus TaxID=5936 RepID=A0AAD1XSR8_EUPCR|nr:unnamed protein product [Moneuplotes crassus]
MGNKGCCCASVLENESGRKRKVEDFVDVGGEEEQEVGEERFCVDERSLVIAKHSSQSYNKGLENQKQTKVIMEVQRKQKSRYMATGGIRVAKKSQTKRFSRNFKHFKGFRKNSYENKSPDAAYNPFKKDLKSIPSFDCLLPPGFEMDHVVKQEQTSSEDSELES